MEGGNRDNGVSLQEEGVSVHQMLKGGHDPKTVRAAESGLPSVLGIH